MKKTLITAVSAFALLTAMPAFADSTLPKDPTPNEEATQLYEGNAPERTMNQNDTNYVSENELREGWNDTKAAVSETADDVSDATRETYNDIKASLIDGSDRDNAPQLSIDARQTAEGMIGTRIGNTNGETVGSIDDIIVDRNGNAEMIVVADGEILGLGKKVAFDYDLVTTRNAEGDVIAPLSEDMIAQAVEFSYDRNTDATDVQTLPMNSFSVSELLDSNVVDTQNNTVAEVDNISFSGGQADQLIVGFGKILGLGGDQAVMSFNEAELVTDEDRQPKFKLSAAKAAQFETYKNSK